MGSGSKRAQEVILDHRAIIDVVCKSGLEKLAGEISALLGQDLSCSQIHLDLTSKARLFSDPTREKTILAHMSVGGEREGQCYLLTRASTAAILGGTLIMLPQDMIEEHAKTGTLDGELQDAYSEVANIIAGVFTQAFVDKYPKTIRFIKKTIEELTPTKIDPDADTPFPPGNYYLASCQMSIDDQDLGPLEFVVPAAIFDLEESAPPAAQAAPVKPAQPEPAVSAPEQPRPVEEPKSAPPQVAEPAAPQKQTKKPFVEAKKIIDVVFKATIGQIGEEIGALLGQSLKCDDVQLVMTSKADFFSQHCLEKSVLTHLKVTGDKEGLGFMLTQIPDAIIMGGTLIMLPEDQIEEQQQAGQFDGEVADAYGEIANILSGSLTQTFLDRYPGQIRFIKTDSEVVVPTKVDIASAAPFPEGDYYLASFAIHMEDYELQRMLLIFPAEVFQLDGTTEVPATGQPAAAAAPAPGEWGGPPATPATPDRQQQPPAASQPAAPAVTASAPTATPIVMIVSDQQNATAPFVDILSTAGYECRVLSFQDEVKELFQQHNILGIFLVMAQVGEKGFAAAIKLQSAGRTLPPIIFAGPEWTRSAVLRAVKYGAKDILMTPASHDEIREKVDRYLKKAS